MKIIATTDELKQFCYEIKNEEYLAIDTEFFRETTYYPKLCLIQVATEKQAVVIDALNMDISPLGDILNDASIVKIFHSAKQDLEVLYNYFKFLPVNVFDTQIAASFCEFGYSISYEALVLELLNIQIDKTYRVSDWTKRPLLRQQVEYALGDVIYLQKIYLILLERLKENNRLDWAIEDSSFLNDVKNFDIDTNQAWKKIKNPNEVSVILKKLAAWREIKAQQADLPRNHYLKEKALLKLAEVMPINIEELRKINYFAKIDQAIAKEIISVISNALKEPEEINVIHNNSDMLSLVKKLLHLKAEEYKLPQQLIATNSDLKSFVNGEEEVRFLSGWRYNIFGKQAIDLLLNK